MNLYSLCLSSKAQFKLQLFINKKENLRFDLKQFSKDSFLSYRTTLNYETEVKSDLIKIHNSTPNDDDSLYNHVTIDQYLAYIYRSSLGCQLIYHSFASPDMTISKFLTLTDSSNSSVRKFVSQLNKYLARYNIRFSYTKFALIGDEQIIQLFYYLFFQGPYFEINSLLSKTMLEKITNCFINFFCVEDMDSPYMMAAPMRSLLISFKINIIRLLQGHKFTKIYNLPPTKSDIEALTHWYVDEFNMDYDDGKIHAIYIDYFLSFSPYALVNEVLSVDVFSNLLNIEKKSINYVNSAILNMVEKDPLNRYLELRLFSNILFTLIFKIPFIHEEDAHLSQNLLPKDADTINKIYSCLFEKNQNIGIPEKKIILKILQIYRNSISLHVDKVKIYFSHELFFTGYGFFANSFKNFVEFGSLKTLKLPPPEPCIVVYKYPSPITSQLRDSKNIILYQWVTEISYNDNINRIFTLLFNHKLAFYALF